MADLEYAMVVFIDMRGFTVWSSRADVGHHLQKFMNDFYGIFYQLTKKHHRLIMKPNGDGVILVFSTGCKSDLLNSELDAFLSTSIPYINNAFYNLCDEYKSIMRCAIPLKLGFGISSGLVHRIKYTTGKGKTTAVDFVSGTMNFASRLCDLARPEGIVIAEDAFPGWVPERKLGFQRSLMAVKSFSDLPVWISGEIGKDHAPREMKRKLVEFHVGTVCYEPDIDTILLAHRKANRVLYPSLWETGGGHIHEAETVEQAAQRSCSAEYGLDVVVKKEASITTYLINLDRISIPGIKFLCLFKKEDFKGIYDVRQHSEVKLVSISDLTRDDVWPEATLIPGSKNDIMDLVTRYKSIVGKSS